MAFDLDDAHLGAGMTLVVVQRDGSGFVHAAVRVAGAASGFLAEAWERTVDQFAAAEKIPYSPEVVIRPGEGRVVVIDEDLRAENNVIAALLDETDRPLLGPNEVDDGQLYLHAVISTTAAGRVAAIKKRSPARHASKGKRWALAHDTLQLMDDDPWQLYPVFDILVGVDGAYASSVNAFEQLFTDAERLIRDVGDWVQTVADALPMGVDQQQVLVARSQQSSRVRRRLRSIVRRGHLVRVDIDDVRRHVAAFGLAVEDFVSDDGELVVEQANVDELLQVLNEDLFRGGLTGDRFRSEGKEPI